MLDNSGFSRRKFIQLAGVSTLGVGLLNFDMGRFLLLKHKRARRPP